MLATARNVLTIEADGVRGLIDRLGPDFIKATEMILESQGKVITTGIGKSGIVARKIMATLNSTGTTSLFLHPVEALHGDLGMVDKNDVILALSNSGETAELLDLIPALKDGGAKIVALTGNTHSTLARVADAVLDCHVEREACPLGLAPTTSTTATLAMGDALSVVLIEKRRFNAEDFRRRHPGGHLGDRLSLKVSQVMEPMASSPTAGPNDHLTQAIKIMDKGDIGTVLIQDQGYLKGIFTDGDLRRLILSGGTVENTMVYEVMTADPFRLHPETMAADALHLMEEKLISALPIVDHEDKLLGIVHLHDLLGRGQVSFNSLTYRD
ncbi:KpsF/GutQ family protein [Dethiosulfatarculus sandiegensis]|uniref:KpsF/GutQ family protein n=1 Tax=Dethiosulfatarculus sandiegensis TaxID=1429043 RepID=A0A0D2JIR9_9BACT|nr:KpsF/GutQ family protein [Dethiosulfatarculus sandiegensis]